MDELISRQSQDLYRLPRHIVPIRYDLRLEPFLDLARFTGAVSIAIEVSEPTAEIVLNAAELDLVDAFVWQTAGGASIPGRIRIDGTSERAQILLERGLSPGRWVLQLGFTGTLNDKLRGFYRSAYADSDGTMHRMAATQFEATDARRAFPCWDEPDFKAIFSTTLVVDPLLSAVSNTALLSETIEAGKKVLRFADTIKMSTYLVAFVVGRMEPTEPVLVGRTPIRIWAVPGKTQLASFGQDVAAASLRYFESYYGIPYPGDKLDLLAIPDFASGAMENLGAITFRETALLVDQQRATHAELERVADVVAHENAHMWFGDLVTMSWWNGLWLNEAFATFMEMMAVDAWKPEWKRWETFAMSRAAAFSVDGLLSTRPIEYPVRAPKDADAMFDVLTYEKGASVLRMLERYMGPTVFRDGVREYLRVHAYGNADTKDLWVSLGHAAEAPIPELMDGWIFQPGFPLVTATLGSGAELILSQQRFTYLSPPASPDPHRLPPTWHVPIALKLMTGDHSECRTVLLTGPETKLSLPPETTQCVVNADGHGFYRVRYSPELLDRLVGPGFERLAPIERFNLVNDAWATTVAGLFPLPAYLDLTARLRLVRDKNLWAVLLDSFSTLHRLISADQRPAFEAMVRDRVGPLARMLGWSPQPDEDELSKQLRGELIGALGRLGNDPEIQREAVTQYERAQEHPSSVDPNIMPAIVSTLAHTGDEVRYDEFCARFRSAKTPQEERRYLFSLTGFREPFLLGRTLAWTVTGDIRTQDAPFVAGALLGNVHGREQAWTFIKANWDRMDQLYPKNGLRRMCGGIVGLVSPDLEHDVREFFASKKIDLGGKTLDQCLEQLRIAVAFQQRDAQVLQDYLRPYT
jgi:puromycin-sensitive aminopeptidase